MYLQKVISRKTFFNLVFCCRLEGLRQKWQDLNPDPLVRGMDPWIQIHTKCHGSTTLIKKDCVMR
jgi:hypothetical protein